MNRYTWTGAPRPNYISSWKLPRIRPQLSRGKNTQKIKMGAVDTAFRSMQSAMLISAKKNELPWKLFIGAHYLSEGVALFHFIGKEELTVMNPEECFCASSRTCRVKHHLQASFQWRSLTGKSMFKYSFNTCQYFCSSTFAQKFLCLSHWQQKLNLPREQLQIYQKC